MKLSLAVAAAAFLSSAAYATPPEIDLPLERHVLDNGLEVILQPDRSAPVVGVSVTYDVGSRNEEPGRSGFAHLFEHMMFQGSANVGKGEHFIHISRNGGRMNGTTSEDRTNYFEVLPADRLELALWLEADRMRSLDISLENFENQRQVVKEERRLRVDNQPYVPAWLEFQELFYDNWAYAHSVIGSMDDLDAAELGDVQAFFDAWYRPSNAVLVIVGDFEPATALELVERHFGNISSAPAPPQPDITEPQRIAPLEVVREDPLATQPAAIIGWQIPPADHPDHHALELLGRILSDGESSRLHRRLVRDDRTALDVSAGPDGKRGPDMFVVWAIANEAPPEAIRDGVMDELMSLRAEGITEEELAAARTRSVRDHVTRMENVLARAVRIGQDAVHFDDPARFTALPSALYEVTVEDVERVARTWLLPEAHVTMLIRIGQDPDEEGDR
jgi:predicted Zn-dependent peptidase